MKVRKHPHAGKQGHEHEFLKLVGSMTGAYRHSEVFDDFLELSFCAVAKTTKRIGSDEAEALEERYMVIARKREREYLGNVAQLFAITAMALESGKGGDFLGRVSGELGALNSQAGQFFTPFEVSKLMAHINLQDVGAVIEAKGFLTITEPACGAGGMLLAAAEVVDEMGFDPCQHMYFEATDISNTAVKMAYLQLSMRGLAGRIIHGNTLSLEMWSHHFTPGFGAFYSKNREGFLAWREEGSRAIQPVSSPAVAPDFATQLDMFGDCHAQND